MKLVFKNLIISLCFFNKLIGDDGMNENQIELNKYKIWTSAYGNPNNDALILVTGGPGAPSYYFNPLLKLSDKFYVIIFDPIGSGRSTRQVDTADLSIDFFLEQIDAIRNRYKLDKFNIYGQSFGATFAAEYYRKYPNRINSIIFSSPYFDTEKWQNDSKALINNLPEEVRNTIKNAEITNDYSSESYSEAVNYFYNQHVARKQPWSDDLQKTFAELGTDVYVHLWGPNEFTPTGKFLKYSCLNILSEIKVPTLIIIGKYDEVLLETAQEFKSKIKNSILKVNDEAAHLTMHDNAEFDLLEIEKFLLEF